MLHFTVPTFTPRALEELHSEPDEVSSLVYMEDAIAKELTTIREHNKNAVPLGQLPQQDEEPEEPEDDRNAAGPGSTASTEGVSDQDGMESAGSDVELDMI